MNVVWMYRYTEIYIVLLSRAPHTFLEVSCIVWLLLIPNTSILAALQLHFFCHDTLNYTSSYLLPVLQQFFGWPSKLHVLEQLHTYMKMKHISVFQCWHA